MLRNTVFLYGSPEDLRLRLIFEGLDKRNKRKIVYLLQENFPYTLGLRLENDDPEMSCWILPEGDLFFGDAVSVALAGYYIDPTPLNDLLPEDVQYAQTESWAALIAAFGQLEEQCVVANPGRKREMTQSRWAQMALLQSRGLPTPRHIVSSEPEEARDFLGGLKRPLFRKASDGVSPFREVTPDFLARLDQLSLCPVYFEEGPAEDAWIGRIVMVGEEIFVMPEDPGFPDELLDKMQKVARFLDLKLAEFPVRRENGGWLVSGIQTFLTPEALSYPDVLEETCLFLEGK